MNDHTELEKTILRSEKIANRLTRHMDGKPLEEVILAAGYLVMSLGESLRGRFLPEDTSCYDEAVEALINHLHSVSEGDLGETLVIVGLAIGKIVVDHEETED